LWFHFDKRVQILHRMTSSWQELPAALGKLEIPGEAATLIYEAVRQSSEDLMRRQKARKTLILLTDGVAFRDDSGSSPAYRPLVRWWTAWWKQAVGTLSNGWPRKPAAKR
jgi:hypothetical protein